MSLVANLLSALTRSAAPSASAAMPYSAVGKSAAAAALSATTIGFVRPIWFISVGERPLKIRHRVLFSFFYRPNSKPFNLLLQIQTGYGLAMLLQTAVAVRALSSSSQSPLSTTQQLGLLASALHGLWMAGFLLARDMLLETYR